MTTLHRSQCALRLSAILVLLLCPGLRAFARAGHSDSWARDKFTLAERMREALNGRPARDRTRHDYQRVIDAYRRVYFGAPASSKADPSVVAVAELQVEMGRRFDDDKILRLAVKQYQFLRREYPGSKYRFDALFTMGEIYKEDLNDPEQAKATFEEFLRRYPRNRLVDDARDAIAELNQEAKKQDRESRPEATRSEGENHPKTADSKVKPGQPPDKSAEDEQDRADTDVAENGPSRLPRVTMIRHWSTPDYTRVAIDLEQDVNFGSQRIDGPDRIFFDLYDTKLASTLVGKSFDVDDGFLKKIRVAQYKPGLTRVVLEVDDLSDYNAFLLSNPSRLIIDVHGKQVAKTARDGPAKDTHEAKAGGGNGEAKSTQRVPTGASAGDAKIEMAAARGPSAPVPAEVSSNAATDTRATSATNAKTSPSPAAGKGGVPRKVVEADDEEQSPSAKKQEVANLTVEDLRPEVVPSTKGKAASDGATADTVAPGRKPSTARDKSKRASATSTADIDAREARPTSRGDRSLTRALGLKIGKIVIDPGHGGHDTGTIGPDGLLEKDLVLDVGRRLGKLLETRLGAEVVYTRKDDVFIPLETRTAIANKQQADLFVSIHANSSRDPAARGVETYYLNFTSSPESMEVAARENAVSEKSIHELGDLVKKIALKEKIEESHEFASDVQKELHSGLSSNSKGMRDRGVKKAPFIVLIGANMPSILAEISFVSNPADERKLKTPEYRQRIAESLYRGIATYAGGLSGVKVASREKTVVGPQ